MLLRIQFMYVFLAVQAHAHSSHCFSGKYPTVDCFCRSPDFWSFIALLRSVSTSPHSWLLLCTSDPGNSVQSLSLCSASPVCSHSYRRQQQIWDSCWGRPRAMTLSSMVQRSSPSLDVARCFFAASESCRHLCSVFGAGSLHDGV